MIYFSGKTVGHRPTPHRGAATLPGSLRVVVCFLGLFFVIGSLLFPGTAYATYGAETLTAAYPQVIPAAQMCELAAQKLEEGLAELGETRRHELKLIRPPYDMRCPPGEITSEVTFNRAFRYDKRLPVIINTYINGRFYRRATCYYRVVVYDKIVVAKRDLPLEKKISPSDVQVEEREIAERGANYLHDFADLAGMVPARVIRAGTPVTAEMLQSPVVIDMGSPITLVANKNGIVIKIDGIAMQRGRIGKIIKVKNARSSKVLRGRVVDESTVEIL